MCYMLEDIQPLLLIRVYPVIRCNHAGQGLMLIYSVPGMVEMRTLNLVSIRHGHDFLKYRVVRITVVDGSQVVGLPFLCLVSGCFLCCKAR
jgi:hypothetical protein